MSTKPRRDFREGADDLLIPLGSLSTLEKYKTLSKLASAKPRLAVMAGNFCSERFHFDPLLPQHIGWGAVKLGRAHALTFRLQLGPNMVYWLANAADAHVWNAMDGWNRAKTIVLAAHFDDGQVIIGSAPFGFAPGMNELRETVRKASEVTPLFLADVALDYARGTVCDFASSDIGAYPVLSGVQACVVTTDQTEPSMHADAFGARAH
jgi:hypothetical protein